MTITVFMQSEFWALVCCSIVVPALAYAWAARRRRLQWAATCLLGLLMVAVSAADVVLLQILRSAAQHSLGKADDAWFASEISAALYAFPILYGGVGVNFLSAGLIEHFQRLGPSAARRDERTASRRRRSAPRRAVLQGNRHRASLRRTVPTQRRTAGAAMNRS